MMELPSMSQTFSYYQLILGPCWVGEGVVGLDYLAWRYAWIATYERSVCASLHQAIIPTYLADIAVVEEGRCIDVSAMSTCILVI